MKIFFIIISSLFICSLTIDLTFSLDIGIPFTLTDSDAVKGDICYFIAKTSVYKKVTITFTMNNTASYVPFSYIEVEPLSEKISIISRAKNLTNTTIETNSSIIVSASDIATIDPYISFKIKLLSDIKNIIIQIDEEGGAYDLSNEPSKKISHLLPDISYYFYTNASKDLKVNFNAIMDSISPNPIKNIFIYEYEEFGSQIRKKSTQEVSTIEQGNHLLLSFSYNVLGSNRYVAVVIEPSHEINNFEVKMEPFMESFDLENRKSKIIGKLVSEKFYFFLLMLEYILKPNLI